MYNFDPDNETLAYYLGRLTKMISNYEHKDLYISSNISHIEITDIPIHAIGIYGKKVW